MKHFVYWFEFVCPCLEIKDIDGIEKELSAKISENLKQFDEISRIKLSNESRDLLDSSISITLLVIQQIYINSQTSYGKKPFIEDKDKKNSFMK